MAAKAKSPSAKKSAKKKPPSKQAMTAKMRLWLSLFLDKSNPATFLNKAGAARVAGYKANSDNAFASIGCQNYRKLQGEIEKWITKKQGLEAFFDLGFCWRAPVHALPVYRCEAVEPVTGMAAGALLWHCRIRFYRSNTSRTLTARSFIDRGLGMKETPSSRIPRWAITLAV